jgi:hypothetical protein
MEPARSDWPLSDEHRLMRIGKTGITRITFALRAL